MKEIEISNGTGLIVIIKVEDSVAKLLEPQIYRLGDENEIKKPSNEFTLG